MKFISKRRNCETLCASAVKTAETRKPGVWQFGSMVVNMQIRMNRHAFTNRLAIAGILLSLLFSVGEGMRLNPFGFKPCDSPNNLETSRKTSQTVYGPLDVPSQVGSRNKRIFLELDVPAFIRTFEPQLQISVVATPALLSTNLALASDLLTRGPPAASSINS
jgi:hypothetical protein